MSTCGFFVLREQCCCLDLPVECVSHFVWIVEGRWVAKPRVVVRELGIVPVSVCWDSCAARHVQ